ncbi:hypothetical protein PROFUN_00837 [Planoprotostelium fungivorum]|uniref:Uncharacterized protein n=1 Tax=Planoprotostelium fungivorum TaxID=1890364 RepID=A0A2P6P019_9EUKA|nr:hypothetical protein PROFUN_00837 [Planoprotostelium fungivorum]
MSTRAVASIVFPLPIESVWTELRDFTFVGKHISTIDSVKIEDNASPFAVGSVRTLQWKSGEIRKDRLIALNDQYRTLTWEMIESNFPAEASASITTITLYRVTEHNHTLVEWSADFSADVTNDFVVYNQKSFLSNLQDVRKNLTK